MQEVFVTDEHAACPGCGAEFDVTPELHGAEVECPRCDVSFRIVAAKGEVGTDTGDLDRPTKRDTHTLDRDMVMKIASEREVVLEDLTDRDEHTYVKPLHSPARDDAPAQPEAAEAESAEGEPTEAEGGRDDTPTAKINKREVRPPKSVPPPAEPTPQPDAEAPTAEAQPAPAQSKKEQAATAKMEVSSEDEERDEREKTVEMVKPDSSPAPMAPKASRPNVPMPERPRTAQRADDDSQEIGGVTASGIEVQDVQPPKRRASTATVKLNRDAMSMRPRVEDDSVSSISKSKAEAEAQAATAGSAAPVAEEPPADFPDYPRSRAKGDRVACPSCRESFEVVPDFYGQLAECECGCEFVIDPPKAKGTASPLASQADPRTESNVTVMDETPLPTMKPQLGQLDLLSDIGEITGSRYAGAGSRRQDKKAKGMWIVFAIAGGGAILVILFVLWAVSKMT